MAINSLHETYFKKLEQMTRDFMESQADDLEKSVDLLVDAWENGKCVYSFGNGGSASTASHLACDLAKFTIIPGKPRLKALCLNDNPSLISAWTNDSGFGTIFAEQLEPWIDKGDVLIPISVHGGSGSGDAGPWSQNLAQAVNLGKERGAKTIGLSGFDGGFLGEQADICLVAPMDEEPWGTPLIESFHVALHHLLCLAVKERIQHSD